jgi:hypothetical protein
MTCLALFPWVSATADSLPEQLNSIQNQVHGRLEKKCVVVKYDVYRVYSWSDSESYKDFSWGDHEAYSTGTSFIGSYSDWNQIPFLYKHPFYYEIDAVNHAVTCRPSSNCSQ